MNLESRSLSYLICDVLKVEYESPEFYVLFESILLHVCTKTKIKRFHRELAEIINFKELGFTPAQFRLVLADSGYVGANIKFYATYLCTKRGLCPLFAEEMHYAYQVCKCDYEVIYALLSRLHFVRKEIKEYIRTTGNNSKDYCPDNFNFIRDRFSDLLPDLERHAKFVISKKLTFVRKYYNMTRDELLSELMIHSLRAYYKSAPNHTSDLHQLNYLRTSISNKALNMIEAYVSQKRQRLVNMGSDNKENAKFVLTVVAESQLPTNSEGEVQSLDTMMDAENLLVDSDKQEFSMSVDRLLAKYKNKKRGFILAVFCGKEINCFAEWLRKKRVLRATDKTSQDVLASRPTCEAMELVSEYIGISVGRIEKTLRELANELGLYSSTIGR